MNKLEFSKVRASFLQRRYAVRLGRRYAFAAAGVLILDFMPIHLATNGQLATPLVDSKVIALEA